MKNKILYLAAFVALILLANAFWPKEENLTYTKAPLKERIAARSQQNFDMLRDPATGTVPTERLLEAKSYRDARWSKKAIQRAAITGVQWTDIGPDTVGGRTRAIMFDPTDSNNQKVIAAGVTGGMWTNADITNPATQWVKVNDFLDNLAVVSITYDPNNTSTWYAATGEIESHSTTGVGVFKSTDAGVTWSLLSSTSNFLFASDIVARDENGTTALYLGTGSISPDANLAGSANNGFMGDGGLQRSTDGGTTWSQVLATLPSGFPPRVSDVKIDGSNNLVIGTAENAAGENGGDVLRCTGPNCASGSDFATLWDGNSGRTIVAVAPSNSDIIMAVSRNLSPTNSNEDVAYLMRSTDGGANWTNLTIPNDRDVNTTTCVPTNNTHFTRGQAFYDLTIAIHPTNPDVVLMGGINLFRSVDGGATFDVETIWIRNLCNLPYLHADVHEIVFRPGNPDEALFGSDGGVSYSANTGSTTVTDRTYRDHINGYITSQFYSGDIHPTAGQNDYLGGLQDNGSNEWDAANNNLTVEVTGGDGGIAHIDQNNGDVQVTAFTNNVYTQTLDEWQTPNPQPFHNDGGTGRFINPTDLDDINNFLYGANNADAITRCNNIGSPSAACTDIPITSAALGGNQASAIRVNPNQPTTLFVGTAGAQPSIYRIQNALILSSRPSADIGSTNFPANSYISSIDVEVGDSDHLLVTFSNYGVSSVWETTDGGGAWTEVEGNLPDIPVRWGMFNPTNNDQAFLATEMGVWSTDNLDGTSTDWGASNTGLANVRVDMIKARTSDNRMVAATHGRGLFIGDIGAIPTVTLTSVSPATQMENSGTPYTYTFSRTLTMGTLVASFAINGSSTATASDYSVATGGTGAVTFASGAGTVTFPAGAATVTVEIVPTNDSSVEMSETIVMDLTANNSLYTVGTPAQQTAAIQDDDMVPTVSLTSVMPASLMENSGSTFTYTLTRTESTAATLEVNVMINASSTAITGSDYSITAGGAGNVSLSGSTITVAFPAGAATVGIDAALIDDMAMEATETVILDLVANGVLYTVGMPATQTASILDDESCPQDYAGANALSGTQSVGMDFETDGAIESTQIINGGAGNNVDYDSAVSILLNAPFEVTLSTVFHAFIDGCGGLLFDDEDEDEDEDGTKKK